MARVYVGTYGKYNSGSIAGAWIDLDKCATYADFLSKCRAVHKNERDPEFMIQDSEGFPDGMDCMEWLSEQDFNDVKVAEQPDAKFEIIDYSEKALAVTGETKPIADKLKALGGRFNPRLSCGAGWIFSKRKEDELRQLLSGAKVDKFEQVEKGNKYVAWRDEWVDAMDDRRDKEYYKKSYMAAVKLPEGFYVIHKQSIENKFCFHDEGPQYEFYKELMADKKNLERYFLSENLSDLDNSIENLKTKTMMVEKDCDGRAVIFPESAKCYYNYHEGMREMTEPEKKECIKALKFVREAFVKRLNSYLKRYGTSKLHTWTYWAEA